MPGPYSLQWLFTADVGHGHKFYQTLQDRSTRFPTITLTDEAAAEDAGPTIVLAPDHAGYPGVLAEIEAGAERIDWNGAVCFWNWESAWADVADYAERGEVCEFTLTHTDDPDRYVRLILGAERARELDLTPGDMLIGLPGLPNPILVPFSLPEAIWKYPTPQGWSSCPGLRLVYGREVTWIGFPPEQVLSDVAYLIGWKVCHQGRSFQHVLHVRGELS